MTRWLLRALALAIISMLALGTGLSTVQAAEGDATLVPRYKLDQKPFRGVALVTVNNRVVCTGFIVGPRKVVTAAHCLVRDAGAGDFRLKKRLVSKLRIYRAYSQVHEASAGLCRVSRAWAHAKFVKAGAKDRVFGSRAHDYAVLTTSDGCSFPKSAVLRLWATQPGEGELRVGQAVRAAGYPADPRVSRMSGLNMWRTEGKVRPVQNDARHLVFTGYVSMGMSGGPVWKTFNSGTSPCGRRHCVVGLVTECEVNGNGLCKKGLSERLAVRITPQVKQLIRKR